LVTGTNELFPATLKPSRDQGGRKLDFTGLPERIVYPPPNFNPPQPPQPNFDDAADQSEREHRPNLNSPSIKYKIAVVADLGKDAKIADGRFKSFLKEGNIYVQKSKEDPQKYNVGRTGMTRLILKIFSYKIDLFNNFRLQLTWTPTRCPLCWSPNSTMTTKDSSCLL